MIPVVVGIDPSLTATGIAGPAGVTTVRSEGKTGATLRQRQERLHALTTEVCMAVVGELQPGGRALIVIERQIGSSSNGHQHDRSGLWWLIVDQLCLYPAVDVVEATPQQRMKYATGKGRADKDEVLAAVIRRYPDVQVSNNNEADALVFRAMALDQLGQPLAAVPQTHRAALAKVAWPDMPRSNA